MGGAVFDARLLHRRGQLERDGLGEEPCLGGDRLGCDPEHGGFGHLPEYPKARIVRLSEEHGEVDISNCPHRPRVGERVWVIPNHICPCVNLQDQVWVKEEDGTVSPLRVDARGKLN